MDARRRLVPVVVVASVIAFGGFGAVYLWKESQTDGGEARADASTDASADAARVARRKPKPGKGGPRGGKPRGGGHAAAAGNGGHAAAAGNGAHADNGSSVDNGGPDDDEGPDEAPFVPPFRGRGPAGPTYEAAIASNNQEVTIGKQGSPDLTDAQLSGPMRSGSFVAECGAPDNMKVQVKVAIRSGRPVGVTIATSPPDPDIAGCIDRYVRTFTWPSSSKMDSFTTTY